jgi:hypothetical protein
MMQITVGTFNLNNLFSRYNFQGEIQAIAAGDNMVEAPYEFTDPTSYRLRTFMGRLVKGKDPDDTVRVASRIASMGLDVLAVHEVEDISTLKRFVIDNLGSLYPHVVLVEGNDPRLIDVAVLSKLPLGAVTSWQRVVHSSDPTEMAFGRDLLQVEILNASRSRRLFTLFNTHLKSHFLSPGETAADANGRRQRQAEVAARIIEAQTRPNSSYVVAGEHERPAGFPVPRPARRFPGAPPRRWAGQPDRGTPRPGGHATAGNGRVDAPFQTKRSAGGVRAVRPGLGESCARREASRILHRAANEKDRGRQRP